LGREADEELIVSIRADPLCTIAEGSIAKFNLNRFFDVCLA
jgi:hypothetical protein